MRIVRHQSVDSTSERLFAALAAGEARHLDAHIAREQTAGRGRRGSRWHSAKDGGVWLSMLFLPPRPLSGAALTIAAGLAALDAARAAGCARCRLKWPNDVVDENGAKLAGVLVETRGLDPQAPHYVVGVGVDVAQTEFPPDLAAERAVTSLALLGCSTSLAAVEAALLEALPRRVAQIEAGPSDLARDYLDALRLRGARVVAETAQVRASGTLLGLDLEEGLALHGDDGAAIRLPLETTIALRAEAGG